MKTNISELTDKQYYKGLNNRFDNRVKKLRKLGCTYNSSNHTWKIGPLQSMVINGAFVMHADKRVFNRAIYGAAILN